MSKLHPFIVPQVLRERNEVKDILITYDTVKDQFTLWDLASLLPIKNFKIKQMTKARVENGVPRVDDVPSFSIISSTLMFINQIGVIYDFINEEVLAVKPDYDFLLTVSDKEILLSKEGHFLYELSFDGENEKEIHNYMTTSNLLIPDTRKVISVVYDEEVGLVQHDLDTGKRVTILSDFRGDVSLLSNTEFGLFYNDIKIFDTKTLELKYTIKPVSKNHKYKAGVWVEWFSMYLLAVEQELEAEIDHIAKFESSIYYYDPSTELLGQVNLKPKRELDGHIEMYNLLHRGEVGILYSGDTRQIQKEFTVIKYEDIWKSVNEDIERREKKTRSGGALIIKYVKERTLTFKSISTLMEFGTFDADKQNQYAILLAKYIQDSGYLSRDLSSVIRKFMSV